MGRKRAFIAVAIAISGVFLAIGWYVTMSVGSGDPGMPAWVTKETPLGKFVAAPDGTAKGLPYQKWRYLVKMKPPREAVEELVRYLKSAPCVAEVKVDTPITDSEYYVSIIVTSVRGDSMRMIFTPTPD